MVENLNITEEKNVAPDLTSYAEMFDTSNEVNSVITAFKFNPPENALSIKESLEKAGIQLNNPNQIRFVSSQLNHKVFEESFVFNTKLVDKIDVYQVDDMQFKLFITGNNSEGEKKVIEFLVGVRTHSLKNIPTEWLLRK